MPAAAFGCGWPRTKDRGRRVTKRKLPYMPFFTGDWLKDPAVSLCTPTTRGVWIDFLCAMHELDRCGVIAGTREQLARIGRCSDVQLDQALSELQTTRAAVVTERDGSVTVTNRRMNREAKEREANALRQSRHRGSKSSNGVITPLSHLYEVEDEIQFLHSFPEVVQSVDFKKVLDEWLNYKNERRENYEFTGLRKMISHAATRATEHGIKAVIDAMNRAMANGWQGWDQPAAFGPPACSNGRTRSRSPRGISE